MRTKYLLIIFSVATLLNCITSENKVEQRFVLQYTNDTNLKDLSNCYLKRISKLENKITSTIEYSKINQIKIERQTQFETINDTIYTIKIIYDFNRRPIDTLHILAFCNSIKDTSFLYFCDVQKYPPTQPLGFDDYIYSLKEIDRDLYATYKESFIDSSFVEIYFYNKDYYLFKIIKVTSGKYYEFINEENKIIKNNDLNLCFYDMYFNNLKPKKKFYHPYIYRP